MDENLETFACAKAEGVKANMLNLSGKRTDHFPFTGDTFVSGCAHVWASNFIYRTVLKNKKGLLIYYYPGRMKQ